MLNRFCAAATAAIISLGIGTGAFAQISNPKHHYDTINVSTVTDLMAEVGIATTVSQMEDGVILILASVAPGKILILGLDPCGRPLGAGCKELAMVSVSPLVGLPYPTILENLILMNLVNQDFDFAQYFFDLDENIPMAARLEVFEYGISKGNLLWTIGSMVNFSNSFFELLTELKTITDAETTSGLVGQPGDEEERIAALYSAIKPDQRSGTNRPALFASDSFRMLLRSKHFAEDNSWTVNPGARLPTVFQNLSRE